jgi:hypothetical protein
MWGFENPLALFACDRITGSAPVYAFSSWHWNISSGFPIGAPPRTSLPCIMARV